MEREREAPKGRAFPSGYLDRPKLAPENEFLWGAFWDLNTERQVGMGQGPIPVSAIVGYAERYGIDSIDEFDRFKTLIRAMDAVLREPKSGVTQADIGGVKSTLRRHAKQAEP